MPLEGFAARLQELREKAGLTQGALGKRAGFSQRAVSMWEQGHREPSLSNAVALAGALGVEIGELVSKPETPRPKPKRGRPKKPED